ncbi:MAG: enoyl-CoA hydratase/isomerase family protein [candidate division WOR-3 bacterium]|jgi:2-(1,2-epoxy-1,2-dihydrophenyl)acetyl-CoA isomerase
METILLDKKDALLIIKLNRPENLNAITTKMLSELNKAFSDAQKDESIRAILLTGEGRGFCSGQDLKDIDNLENFSFYEHLVNNYNPLIIKMQSLEKPIIVGINGTCAGAGISLALAGDIRICKKSAKFVLAFSNIGLITDSGGSYFLVRMLGISKALELLWTNEIIDSQKALELGIVNKVFEDEEFDSKLIEFSLNIANGPTKAYAISKRLYNRIYELNLNEVLELEAQYQEVLSKSEDFKEGIKAFLEKRKPQFKGK